MRKSVFVLLIVLLSSVSLYAEKPVTTVLDFEINSVSRSDMKSIISFLSASLYDTGKYRVIDTAQRDTILNELEFSLSGCSDDSCQLEIGKLLSAEFIVTGDIARVGTRYILSARMLETETSETVGTAKGIYEDLDAMIDDMPDFADTLAGIAPAAEKTKETAEASAEQDKTPIPVENPEEGVTPAAVKGTPDGNKVIAWSTLGAGAAMLGTGTYFLVDSILKLNAASDAKAAYIEADNNFEELYNAYSDAYDTAENSDTMFWVGTGLIGGGVVSTLVSVIFFSKGSSGEEPPVELAFGPQSFVVKLSY